MCVLGPEACNIAEFYQRLLRLSTIIQTSIISPVGHGTMNDKSIPSKYIQWTYSSSRIYNGIVNYFGILMNSKFSLERIIELLDWFETSMKNFNLASTSSKHNIE